MTIYLNVTMEERRQVLALGAKEDLNTGGLFVPPDMAIAPFSSWLPEAARSAFTTAPVGVSLTALLQRIGSIVDRAFPCPEWVRIEISEIRSRNGHLYLVAIDRDADGNEVSKCKAMIWSSQASAIGAKFFKQAGTQLSAGIKVLVLAQPNFKGQYGLGLVISDIDPSYTLGEMEARLRKIRAMLQADGIADRNRSLPMPKDFFRVAVIAPASAAGLEDFEVEAKRLEEAGLCQFSYCHATFQGEQAKPSLRQAFINANELHKTAAIDALVIIRGGGAAADLHWVNEELLARMVCRFPVPVLTGIGHERDSTILDEYAHKSLGTPSKVVAHISRIIALNAKRALDDWRTIVHAAIMQLGLAEAKILQVRSGISTDIGKRLDRAWFITEKKDEGIRSDATAVLAIVEKNAEHAMANIRSNARSAVKVAHAKADSDYGAIMLASRRSIDGVAEHIDERWASVVNAASTVIDKRSTHVDRNAADVQLFAKRMMDTAEASTQELMEGILSHGVAPTLKRGFAIVRAGNIPISSKAVAEKYADLHIEFKDGSISAKTGGSDD